MCLIEIQKEGGNPERVLWRSAKFCARIIANESRSITKAKTALVFGKNSKGRNMGIADLDNHGTHWKFS